MPNNSHLSISSEHVVQWLEHASELGPGSDEFEYILKYGRTWPSRRLPKGYRRGGTGACWRNSQFKLLQAPDTFVYVEGYAWLTDMSFPSPHAWLIEVSGDMVDLTWPSPEHAAYFGVPLRFKYVSDVVIRRKVYRKIIDASDADWPRLNGKSTIRRAVEPFEGSPQG